ncbi:cytochrome P450 [Mycobacterium kubicae]|nr:cytochrome P450 [Mycobacterium kubicae]MCV7096061.1 cytochrome P450 [Mycobacterium kubicae]OBF17512.1 cytochrome [Mycobacterium kubicae]ORV99422.1 cytochrome [Mycobacterium kubicae]QNI12219.1 cytochrome P450 [Mycobacterium kubicae]QPI35733.1 cytochrome P450 [Mycobacterium kubicae]
MRKPEDDATQVLTDPTAHADEPRLHSALTHLRANAPVTWVDHPRYRPFWAITKHRDIMEVERNSILWINAPRTVLTTAENDDLNRARQEAGTGMRMLVHMDGRHHRILRAIGVDWFRPAAMHALQDTVEKIVKRYIDEMSTGTECDFATKIAANIPLYVIMSLLGVPEQDFGLMLKLTQEVFGRDDKELRRGSSGEAFLEAVTDFFTYFSTLTAARRAQPTDDLASAIANARVDGKYLSDMDTLSYYMIIATAGHDTTSAAIAGGLRALIDHPAELHHLRAHPELMPTAVEEILRWCTPVKHFMRTATDDTEIRGIPIAAGESVYLAYPSGNRDEEVFEDPFRFKIDRYPNKHLGFGHGVHFCLGAALARMELNSFFSALLPRLESIELAGEPALSDTLFVGRIKRLPIRYRLT